MLAIISDVHGNLEALKAVLTDIASQGVNDIFCLGDVVGYGPDPRDCLDLVMRQCRVVLLGNHDQAVTDVTAAWNFNSVARRAIVWTRDQLAAPVPNPQTADFRLRFLEGRPTRHHENGLEFVHASPCDHVNGYVFAEDVDDQPKMARLFAQVERCYFVGHTHIPGVFVEYGQGEAFDFHTPACYRLGGDKALVNVGSVGQPRDGDWRACYVLLDGDAVHFRRVGYDIDTTVRKIGAVPDLAGWLGERLRGGH